MSIEENYKNREKGNGYVVPMTLKKYKEWNQTVDKANKLAGIDRHASENKAEAKRMTRPE